jgi:propanol-preferring alcohol dehydrogenase
MRAMVLPAPGRQLELRDVPRPDVESSSVLLRVEACGVCRTDLHVLDGDLAKGKYPLIPGHQIVGVVEEVGAEVSGIELGARVGAPWLGRTCRSCRFCTSDRENLCDEAAFTGYDIDGGFAEYAVADHRYVFPIPDSYEPVQAAPLLCAGLIGYRSLRMAGDRHRVGLYGFGAAAHIVAQLATHRGQEVYAFTRSGDDTTQEFARSLGATWAGGSDETPPQPLDAAIIFAPVGALVPAALRAVDKGGVVVCAGIHMSDIPSFPYSILWGERVLRSVANLTRADGEALFEIAPQVPVRTEVTSYALEDAGKALEDLRHGRFDGAAVVVP